MINNICNPKNLRYIYARAKSDSGRDVLEHLGFELQQRGEGRKDLNDLFRAEYATVANRVNRLRGVDLAYHPAQQGSWKGLMDTLLTFRVIFVPFR